jgi:uncharacterized membrane protein YgcG
LPAAWAYFLIESRTSVWIIANLCLAWLRCSTSVAARWTCSLKIEFSFLNCNLMVPGGSSAYLLVDDQRQPNKPLEVLMKRYLGAVAAAALLVGTMAVATDALAAGHGGGGGGFGGGHMGGGFRGPLLESVPSMPPPVFNPSSPYTVPASPETPVSPASPGSVFGNG